MKTNAFLTGTLVAAVFVSGQARAGDGRINVVTEKGKTVAEFKVGDSHCVLKDDRLSCVPVRK
jgi:hypothetical protein